MGYPEPLRQLRRLGVVEPQRASSARIVASHFWSERVTRSRFMASPM